MGYHQMRRRSEEVVSVGFSKASSLQPPATRSAVNRIAGQQQQQRMRQQQQAEEQRAQTPQTTNGRILAMARKLESASFNKEDVLPKMKSSVTCGDNLAERKRQLGFTAERKANNAPLKAALIDNRSIRNYKVPSPTETGSVLPKTTTSSSNSSSSSVKNRIVKSKFVDKKKMFERAVERNQFHREAATYSTKVDMESNQVPLDSDCSPLVYDGSLASGDTATARDEVEARRPRQPRDDREDSQLKECREPCQTEASSLAPDPSFQEALDQIVTSFEKCVQASEATTATGAPFLIGQRTENDGFVSDIPMHFDSWGYVTEVPQMKELGEAPKLSQGENKCQDNLEAQQNRSRNEAKLERVSLTKISAFPSKSERLHDLSPSQLVPGGSLFRTVDQEKHNKKSSHKQEKDPRERAKELRKATTTTVPMKEAAKSKKTIKSGRNKTSSRSKQYELFAEEPKEKLSRRSVLRQPHEQLLQTVSTASWYSSENDSSVVSTEISQNLSPLQDPYTNRMSIGACINAHLAVNPNTFTESEESVLKSHQERKGSVSSATTMSMKKLASSQCSMDAQYDGSVQRDAQDFHELAETMTNMANTASNAVLDYLVDAADKVVVSPLISVFHCVDASEHLLCNGSQRVPSVKKFDEKTLERNRKKSRSHSASRPRKSKPQKDRKASIS